MSIRYLLALALLATGCVGTLEPAADDVVGDDDVPSGAARQKYEADVYPILSAKCAGCHTSTAQNATPFVGTTKANSYVATVGFSSVVGNFTEAGAPLYTRVVPGPHNGATYTADDKTKILAWMALEVTERSGGTTPTDPEETPAQITARLISEWSGCLKDTDFTALNFGITWANKGSNQGNCEQCHTSFAYGFGANDDNLAMYEAISTSKYYMLAYFQADLTDLANPKMIPNFKNFERVGLRQVPHQEHPSFNTDRQDTAFTTLQTLYDTTMGYKTAGTCGTPRIPM